MKAALLSLLVFFISSAASAKEIHYYACTAKPMKPGNTEQPQVHARLYFYLEKSDDGSYQLQELVGHIQAGSESPKEAYYNIFDISKKAMDTAYKPNKYKNTLRFKGIDSHRSSRSAEIGMSGELIIEREFNATTQAYYQFKAGDHLSGSITFLCAKTF